MSLTLPVQINPAFNVATEGKLSEFKVACMDTCAIADDLDRGLYPIFDARDTTFSLRVAESKKDSLTAILELNAVM